MNYHFNMEFNLAFECPEHPAREHLCIVDYENELMVCNENSDPHQLEHYHKVWFPSSSFQDANTLGGSTDTSITTISSPTLSFKDHGKVTEYLGNFSNQEIIDIGVKLGIRYIRFKRMSYESLMNDMVHSWLRKDDDVGEVSGDPSWKTLCTVLQECGHTGIAENIEKKVLGCLKSVDQTICWTGIKECTTGLTLHCSPAYQEINEYYSSSHVTTSNQHKRDGANINNEGREKELLDRYGVTEQDCSKVVSDIHLTSISYSCCAGGVWKTLTPYLEIRRVVVDAIHRKQVDEEEKRSLFFFKWKQMKGSEATYLKLVSALLMTGHRLDAEKVLMMLRNSSSSSQQFSSTSSHHSIEAIPEVTPDAERRLRVHQRMIKEKHVVKICVLIFNYLGLPRSGKTTFRRRIMGEIINILQAGEIEQPSTGVVEDGGQVLLLSKTEMGALISSKVWSVFREGDEANMLGQLLHQLALQFSQKPSMDTMAMATDNTPTVDPNSSKRTKMAEFLLDSASSSTSASKNEDEEMLSVISDVLESENWDELKYLLDDLTLITSNDAGGHAEFLDLHAALIHGPSFNLFFSRLQDDFDKVFEISYTNKRGESTTEGNSTVTVEEALFQALASVACFGCPQPETLPTGTLSEKHQQLSEDSESVVMFVCTHLDLVNEKEREKVFADKDKTLRKKVETTEFYKNRVIEYVSRNQLMIKANNFSGDEVEIENIRSILMKAISRIFNKKIEIPASWLILSLYLRKHFSVISLKDCQEIASKLRLDPEELQDALWFLHHRVGALLYYSEVEAMRDTVICKRQVVFDSASKLIRDTFTVDNVGHSRCMAFEDKGQFFQKDIKSAIKKAGEEAGSDSLISLEKLVSLFEHRSILTRITSSSVDEVTYFMPCVLRSASKEKLKVTRGENDPSSLMLYYDCGYMPLGIFPAIITNLVSQQRKNYWRLIEEDIYKNRVQFHVGSDYDEVTLMSHPRYFEIAINRAKFFKVPTSTLCSDVRNTVLSTLDKVTSNMNYHFNMECNLGFECPKHPAREHLCIIAAGNKLMLCYENSKKPNPLQLEDYHKVWFSSTHFQDANTAGGSTDTGTSKTSSYTLSFKEHGKVKEHLANLSNQELINIGVRLGIRYIRFKRMSCESLMDDMVQSWLRKDDDVGEVSGDPSWDTLCTVLKECGYTGIAENIEKKEIATRI